VLDLPPPVLPTDKWLATVRTRGGCTPADREAIGLSLRAWQHAAPWAGHVWGLDDLRAGRRPRTPSILPLSYRMSPDAHEPIALACVAADAPDPEAWVSLVAALGDLRGRVVVMDVDTYCHWKR
jgi:hypothetical protein